MTGSSVRWIVAGALTTLVFLAAGVQAREWTLEVAGHTVTNIGPWEADTRLEDRPDDLWRYYMHGIVDHFATPVAWEQLAGEEQDLQAWLVEDPIDTPYKRSQMPALRIAGETSLELARPLPIPMDEVRGRRVRLFVWLRGDDVGARNNCWHAPSLYVTFRDADGSVLLGSDSYFKTLRTYPWHCYYTDRFVPEDAAGIYVRPFNKFHGVAYFSTLSWELLGEDNTYELNDRQDPVTGSTAPNPLYDEMPYQLKHGLASRYTWRFVLGEDAGLIGQPYNITTHEGFRRYYFEKAKHEPEHMNHAILFMGSMYRAGTENDHLPPMEEGWLENFAQVLRDDQDPETGYWHDGFELSLGLTFHLCNMHFRYWELPRADRPDRRSGHHLGVDEIPRADRIVRTTLELQSTYEDATGTRRLAAWNWPAYRWVPDPDEYEQKCYLGTTWDAIWLLRAASRYVDEEARGEIYESVKAALHYVFEACVLPDGTWKQHDTDDAPSKGDYMWGIMQDSAWLERKIRDDVPTPEVSVTRADGGYRFEWRDPVGEQNSVRIYATPDDAAPEEIDESRLVGIIQRTGHVVQGRLRSMDPLVGAQFIRRAGQRRFGWSEELPDPETWRGRRYLPWKLRMLDPDLTHSMDREPLTLNIPAGHDVYVSAATWYGEESPPQLLALPSQAAPTGADSSGGREVDEMETATFGAGCFWGVEEAFIALDGVTDTTVGYAGGGTENPTYEQVCTDTTGHAEVVQLQYDPEEITYERLVEVFFDIHDPTQVDRQGPDVGSQYRSVIFYHTPEQKRLAEEMKRHLDGSGQYRRPIATQIEPAPTFWRAEQYHQRYIAKRAARGRS